MTDQIALSEQLAGWALSETRKRLFPKLFKAQARAVFAQLKLQDEAPRFWSKAELSGMQYSTQLRVLDEERDFAGRLKEAQEQVGLCGVRLELALRNAFSRPGVLAYGRPWSPDAELQIIAADLVSTFTSLDWASGAITLGKGSSERTLYSVHVIPTLLAPSPAARIVSPLDVAVAAHVWGDPELAAIESGMASRVGEALADKASAIPISDSAPKLARALNDVLIAHNFGPQRQSIIEVAADRFARLFGLFMSGQLEAIGQHRLPGMNSRLLPSDWRRANTQFCLASSAVLHGGDIAWTDLTISEVGCTSASANWQAEAGAVSGADHSALLDDSTAAKARPGAKFLYGRLADFDAMIAERLTIGHALYHSMADVDRELAKRERDRLGVKRGGPKDQAISEADEKKVSEWLLDRMPKTRTALTSKR